MPWRPLPNSDEPPITVGTSLESVVQRLGVASLKEQQKIFQCWPTAVGDEINSHAKPINLTDGVLSVEVDDPRWLTQLKWLGGRLADQLNEASGTQLVERLNVRLTSSKSTKSTK